MANRNLPWTHALAERLGMGFRFCAVRRRSVLRLAVLCPDRSAKHAIVGSRSALGLGLIKLYFFMEFQKNAIIREIKRVELQVAGLTAALRIGKADAASGR